MQDEDKVRTSLLNFMACSDIEAPLEISEQEISENKNSNNNNNIIIINFIYLFSP